MEITFEQGLMARPFKEQFPEFLSEDAQRLDALNKAIGLLYVHDMLTESVLSNIRQKRMPKAVAAAWQRAQAQQKGPRQ